MNTVDIKINLVKNKKNKRKLLLIQVFIFLIGLFTELCVEIALYKEQKSPAVLILSHNIKNAMEERKYSEK